MSARRAPAKKKHPRAQARDVARARQRRLLMLLALLVLVAVFGSYAARIAYEQWRVLDITVVPYSFEVVDEPKIGFALGTDDLSFGKIVPGGGGTRTATVTTAVPVRAVSLSDRAWLTIVPADTLLVPGEHSTLTFDLAVPQDASVGNYTGEIRIVYLRRLPWE